MHDIQFIRENPDAFDAGLKRRGLEATSAEILVLDTKRRELVTSIQQAQGSRNELSKKIGELKSQKQNADPEMAEVAKLKDFMAESEAVEAVVAKELQDYLDSLPNLPAADVPDGADENQNVEASKWGTPRQFNFDPQDHVALGEKLGQMDFERAAKLSGARFVVMTSQLARLERALGQFMLDTHTKESGYTEVSAPLMVNAAAMYGVAQLPKFAEDMFKTDTGHYLVPTSEASLTNFVAGDILDEKTLPIRLTTLSPCFRSEAGSAGRDTRGIIRQHQFYKVEMVSITTPEQSVAEHERMTAAAESILQKLELPYRKLLLCTGDMGFASQKTYDLEVWVPSQGKYREISSCSNCGDFQARRMNARFRPENGVKKTEFLHTLNGSGTAVGRCLVAVMENYQNQDGSITVPQALRPYMNGLEVITKA